MKENGIVEIVRPTEYGKLYLESNPHLRNPVDWKWIITTIIATITAIGTILMVLVACNTINQ